MRPGVRLQPCRAHLREREQGLGDVMKHPFRGCAVHTRGRHATTRRRAIAWKALCAKPGYEELHARMV
jgi:hypothetical protein